MPNPEIYMHKCVQPRIFIHWLQLRQQLILNATDKKFYKKRKTEILLTEYLLPC